VNGEDQGWTGLDPVDPVDWDEIRALGHRMMDDMVNHLAGVRDRKVWTPMPAAARAAFRAGLPHAPAGAAAAYQAFKDDVLPYELGNTNPRFMGWVHGGGNAVGMLAELLAGGLNANLGGRDQAPVEVERQVIRWSAEMLGFPAEASGQLVTGTSIANLMAVLVARTHRLGPQVRSAGICGVPLRAYTSADAHSCVPRAMDMAGFGSEALRLVGTDAHHRMDIAAVRARIAADRAAGQVPFLLIGTAGSVDTGAIDDLRALADLCAEQGLWFHVDAAFGAMLALSATRRGMIAGIERADSVAFDFHKWAQVPYDSGCLLVRDGARQMAAFAQNAAYLRREARGMAGGAPWLCDLGPDLSRGFRALKVWMTLIAYGADRIGAAVDHSCEMAQALAARVRAEARLQLMAPVNLNIVCFRYCGAAADLDRLNVDIVADIQEAGLAAPSTTVIDGKLVIRAAMVNHRIRASDVDALVDAVLQAGARRAVAGPPAGPPGRLLKGALIPP
jgi:glutamate/tyrosine decarboxylase-like PLP-dependent enzyme